MLSRSPDHTTDVALLANFTGFFIGLKFNVIFEFGAHFLLHLNFDCSKTCQGFQSHYGIAIVYLY